MFFLNTYFFAQVFLMDLLHAWYLQNITLISDIYD